ncbi:hypothetical protein Golax_017270 [Gossypium laxum]|uniref:Uncharacterized protein n=2 Tax=Gossypium TaxID=3633 RepID=A0A7J8QXR6_GOSDV|nr:hypothetical protein [Gossypium davidsonii]MBA0705051.1 hypothetical protein [Gossypium laxum]
MNHMSLPTARICSVGRV